MKYVENMVGVSIFLVMYENFGKSWNLTKKNVKCVGMEEPRRIIVKLIHCKYLQPIYSHLLCYISNCSLAAIIKANGSTYDCHWHWGVQFKVNCFFGLNCGQPNYSWKCNTTKSCTEYSQDICSVPWCFIFKWQYRTLLCKFLDRLFFQFSFETISGSFDLERVD